MCRIDITAIALLGTDHLYLNFWFAYEVVHIIKPLERVWTFLTIIT